ncbi:hypothetical protein SDC9_209878 [bioreactor metagenome]|uniref:Uncharacterized protein n=1 Tax=bioreactor metagenome TaxID=1076179 RepID=A0A645JEV1_9ZZZZ
MSCLNRGHRERAGVVGEPSALAYAFGVVSHHRHRAARKRPQTFGDAFLHRFVKTGGDDAFFAHFKKEMGDARIVAEREYL